MALRDERGRFIATKVTVQNEMHKVKAAATRAKFENFFHAAASIRKTATQSIVKAEGPSEEGEPPHTHQRVFLRRAIRFDVNQEGAIIGPRASIVGAAGEAHEFGGQFKGQMFPERPFMRPALEENLDRFASEWDGSITS